MTVLRELMLEPVVWLIAAIPICIAIWQARRTHKCPESFWGGLWRSCFYSLVPALLYVAGMLAAVLLEEITKAPIVGEGFARVTLPVIAIGMAMALLGLITYCISRVVLRLLG